MLIDSRHKRHWMKTSKILPSAGEIVLLSVDVWLTNDIVELPKTVEINVILCNINLIREQISFLWFDSPHYRVVLLC